MATIEQAMTRLRAAKAELDERASDLSAGSRSLVQQLERGLAVRGRLSRLATPAQRPLHLSAVNLGAIAIGAVAVGAVAIGALAIARLAIGRLSIGRARIRDLDIENLTVHHLRVQEEIPFRPDDPGPRKAGPDQDVWEPS